MARWTGRGRLARRLAGTPDAAAGIIEQTCQALVALPAASPVPVGEFAPSVLGGAHALDDGTPVATLVVGAARTMSGTPPGSGACWRRLVWESVGLVRDQLTSTVLTLIAETEFSHPSKIELIDTANRLGFDVRLHVVMVQEGTSVERVRTRVLAGGHSVPEEKIRERHRRLWALIAAAVPRTYSATIYDNSRRGGPTVVARFADGFPTGAAYWPRWTPPELTELWDATGGAPT